MPQALGANSTMCRCQQAIHGMCLQLCSMHQWEVEMSCSPPWPERADGLSQQPHLWIYINNMGSLYAVLAHKQLWSFCGVVALASHANAPPLDACSCRNTRQTDDRHDMTITAAWLAKPRGKAKRGNASSVINDSSTNKRPNTRTQHSWLHQHTQTVTYCVHQATQAAAAQRQNPSNPRHLRLFLATSSGPLTSRIVHRMSCTTRPKGSLSHWLSTSPSWGCTTQHGSAPPHQTHDVAIVGAGITGCALAYHLRSLDPNLKVVVIEARGISEGATGRNGGLMWPSLNAPWPITVAQYGQAGAQQLMQFELHAFQDVLSFIQGNQLEEQLEFSIFPDGGYILAETQDELDLEVADLAAQKHVGVTPLVTLLTPEDITQRLGPHHFVGGLHQDKVAQVTAVRLAHALLHKASQMQPHGALTIMQHTRVTGIKRLQDTTGEEVFRLEVQSEDSGTVQSCDSTHQGNVYCRKLVHCTNGYNHLLPQLIQREWLMPVRNQVAVTPKLPADHPLPHAAFYARTGYVYFSRRMNDHVVIGGFRHVTPHMEWGTTDDSSAGLDGHVSKSLRTYLPATFPHLFADKEGSSCARAPPAPPAHKPDATRVQQPVLFATPTSGATVARQPTAAAAAAGSSAAAGTSAPFLVTYDLEWSGILGFTKDRWPLVGMLPPELCAAPPPGAAHSCPPCNEFACMGFSGHGMTRAFTCARNVAHMLLGQPLEPSFPAHIFTPNRVLAADTPTVPSLPYTRHAAATVSKL